MKGPTPKPTAARQRRNKESTAATLTAGRIRLPPKLPEPREVSIDVGEGIKITQQRPWHQMAVDFWKEVRRSPMVKEYIQADLPGLLILADLIDLYWHGDKKLAAEIRQQRTCFGLTPIDRRRLQWTVQRVEAGERRREPPRESQRQNPEDIRSMMLKVLA